MVASGVRNTQGDLWTLVKHDFTGSDNFVYWLVAILAIGSLGYVEKIRPAANALLALVIIVLFLSNKGFFPQFLSQIKSTNTASGSGSPINIGNLGSLI